ncbi:hypothetical protein PMY38_11810 [Clostridium tertium]|uniref:hypothetical protein n=1 Tax=Clostridium tertium TaxID=1559 RepID=UPI000C06DA7E|nr:hypothetical protein [Clostridium tertium]MBS6503488.1 hypothetical protein [Clostridium sp.]MDB1956878.1 hypothetical protein [Clostridium tertium]MDB1959286.1 hypothetical protein [Clostridium tertium]MDB1963189.1 hypothetical protein [Clostridium tertium]MDB1967867.1 hypothetical protein [Clostridium tertium]
MKDYLERCNDIVKKVEEENIKNELKRSTTILLEFIPNTISILKSVYDEMLKSGFNEAQSYDFACKFIIETHFRKKE